jgi:beta-glucanase (GH16 family)
MQTRQNKCRLLLVLLALSLGVISTAAAQGQTTPEPTPVPEPTPIEVPEGWELVWHDEFDGDTIDEENWTYDLGGHGWGNGESQHYTNRSENARIEDGMLVIEARQESYMGSYYTSARLKSEGLQEFQYGRIEARLKVPAGRGLWPAFWMLGSNFGTVGWPDCGEIDIMEYIGREPDLILGTIHGPGYSGALGLSHWNRQDYDIADDFHTYAVEWDEDQITWFYDGEEYGTYTRRNLGQREWVFDQPFFIILNLAVGGTLPGPIGLDTVFPAQYLIDYVRVFQQ